MTSKVKRAKQKRKSKYEQASEDMRDLFIYLFQENGCGQVFVAFMTACMQAAIDTSDMPDQRISAQYRHVADGLIAIAEMDESECERCQHN